MFHTLKVTGKNKNVTNTNDITVFTKTKKGVHFLLYYIRHSHSWMSVGYMYASVYTFRHMNFC